MRAKVPKGGKSRVDWCRRVGAAGSSGWCAGNGSRATPEVPPSTLVRALTHKPQKVVRASLVRCLQGKSAVEVSLGDVGISLTVGVRVGSE